jgi:hypothetical protein
LFIDEYEYNDDLIWIMKSFINDSEIVNLNKKHPMSIPSSTKLEGNGQNKNINKTIQETTMDSKKQDADLHMKSTMKDINLKITKKCTNMKSMKKDTNINTIKEETNSTNKDADMHIN